MRLTGKARVAWVEGVVNRSADYVSIAYGEGKNVVALVGRRPNNHFTVQFLLEARAADPHASRILDDVRRELTYYLLQAVGPDSWPFVQYHCGSPANRRSAVHWRWHPKSAGRSMKAPPSPRSLRLPALSRGGAVSGRSHRDGSTHRLLREGTS